MEFVVGHRGVIERLRKVLVEGDRYPHSLLFVGREGIGKRRVAVLASAFFLCPNGGCLECRTCRRILRSAEEGVSLHPDFRFESLAAGKKSISIEQMRALKEWAYTTPMEGGRKAAVVDDAHLMNVHAANALLKTLEEPPEGTLFILVTSEPSMLPSTIVSRCQMVRFTPLTKEEVEEVCERKRVPERIKELCVEIGSLRFIDVPPEEVKAAEELVERFMKDPSLKLMSEEIWREERSFLLFLMLLRKRLNSLLLKRSSRKLWELHRRLVEVEKLVSSSNVSLRSLYDYLLMRVA